MRTPRFLAVSIFITFICLIYVYQQTEIYRLGYINQRKLVTFQDLLDKNSILRYNMEKRTSLIDVANHFNNDKELQMPQDYRVVRLLPQQLDSGLARSKGSKQENIFARIFGLKRQAEAKTINP
ncbi:MAG: hypothetical protein NC912_04345 [Candidatus Omnitrophica bacterium]|nr:hypothetical protein [Candidatus Omnitrophota bacterium]